MSINYTPRTWVTGEVVTAAYMNTEVRDAFTGLMATWTTYSPQLTGTVTNPATFAATGGRWLQVGKTVLWKSYFQWGGSTTNGSGGYAVLLPATPENTMGAGYRHCGRGTIFHSVAVYDFTWQTSGANPATLFYVAAVGGSPMSTLGATAPITFASGDTLSVGGIFEAA